MKVKCDICSKHKQGIKVIIEYHDMKLNSTKRITNLHCFDCLKLDSVIKIIFRDFQGVKEMKQ